MKFKIDLKNHCIETALKGLYNRAISNYFKHPTKINESQIASLELALKNLNFSMLRSKYPELSGGYEEQITLDIGEEKISIHIPAYKHSIDIEFTNS